MKHIALWAALVSCLTACSDPVIESRFVLDLADQVSFQTRNVNTRLISPRLGVGLDLLLAGWRTTDEGVLQIWRRTSSLAFFSFDGSPLRLVLECAPDSKIEKTPISVYVSVNGEFAGSLRIGAGWSEYELGLPSTIIREGSNRLNLSPRLDTADGADPALLHVRRIELVGSQARSGRSQTKGISLLASDHSEKEFLMPVESFLDTVLEVPEGGRLEGHYRIQGSATITAEVTGQNGSSQFVLERQHPGRGRFDCSLAPWHGQLVRVRIRVGGSDGEVRFTGARIVGTGVSRSTPALVAAAPPPRSARFGTPDILFILLDAARADAFSPFDRERATPAVAGLAGAGTTFLQAFSPSAFTAQSIPSILTGILPGALGASSWSRAASYSRPTLAELLQARGYRTVLWSQHPFYSWRSDLRRGFDVHLNASIEEAPSGELLFERDRPTFAFVHFLPPHAPYEPPEPFRGSLTEWFQGSLDVDPKALLRLARTGHVDGEELRYIRARYQEMASFADDLVGRVLAELRSFDRFDNALVVLLADHGEAFFEHGTFLHTKELYREYVHVPLVVKWPRSLAGYRSVVEAPVSLIDLVPTVIDGLGVDGLGIEPTGSFQGRSLLPTVFDGADRSGPVLAATSGVARSHSAPYPSVAMIHAGWKLIYRPHLDRSELYRVAEDPWEQRELSDREPLRALLLTHALQRQAAYDASLAAGREILATEQLTDEQKSELESLGYL